MNKRILIFLLVLGVLACESKPPDFVIEGRIDGLKKGKIYLQKIQDTAIINIDSVEFYNTNQFRIERELEFPEVMYLQLQRDTIETTDNFIAFFADKGKLTIKAELDEFMFAEVEGDYANQIKFTEYSEIIKRFGDQKLDLIKAEIDARKNLNQEKLDSVNAAYNKMNKRRYLFAINFAIGHPDLEVSPYIVINQAEYISTNYLDTIYQALDNKIRKSYYGSKLKELIDKE
jgi:hypothetical protein